MTAENPSTAVAKQPKDSLAHVQAFLESRRDLISQVAPKHLSPERLIKVALMARTKDKAIAACTTESLLKCVIQAAELGLEAGGPQGHAYLVPYGKELTLIVGYRGMLDLVRRSGMVQRIEAHLIYANDRYKVRFGTDPVLEHEPALIGEPGPVVAAYAIAVMKDGTPVIEVMSLAQLEKIRGRSKAKNSGPWSTDTEEMYRKTVIRRLCKFLPQSSEMKLPLDDEDEAPRGTIIDIVPEPEEQPKSKTSRLKDHVKGQLAPRVDRQVVEEPTAEEQAEIAAQEQAAAEPSAEIPT